MPDTIALQRRDGINDILCIVIPCHGSRVVLVMGRSWFKVQGLRFKVQGSMVMGHIEPVGRCQHGFLARTLYSASVIYISIPQGP